MIYSHVHHEYTFVKYDLSPDYTINIVMRSASLVVTWSNNYLFNHITINTILIYGSNLMK